MATIREITTEWVLPSGAGHLTVMYFEGAIPVEDQRSALATFWGVIDGAQTEDCTWTISTTGRELDDATGTLTGAWNDTTNFTGVGAIDTEPVADATQALIQWRTASIVNGRFLRGRTFIPSLAATQLNGGNLQAATRTLYQGACNALIASAQGLVIWHRPITGSGGSHDAVSTASVWEEFAVLRRRRA